jgi:hypothetical protein
VPISAGHRPYQHVRIHFSPGTLRYFLLHSSGLLLPRTERACAERGNSAAAPPGNQKPQMPSFGFTILPNRVRTDCVLYAFPVSVD